MRLACCLLILSAYGPVDPVRAAQQPGVPCLPLAVTKADGNYIVPGARGGVVYRRVDGQDLRLDVWVPPNRHPDASTGEGGAGVRLVYPAVVVIHGGGFTSGSRVAFVGQFLEMLTAAGYPWLSIDYRLGGPTRAADAVDDVKAAVAFTRCHARELRLDPDRIALLGEETGATLAARVAAQRVPGVIGAILFGGPYPRLPATGGAERAHATAAPSLTARAPSEIGASFGVAPRRRSRDLPLPRFLLVHGTADTEVPLTHAEAWCGSIRGEGGGCELLPVEAASHRPENWWPVQWGYKARVVRWLKAAAPLPVDAPGESRPALLSNPLAAGLHKRISYVTPADAHPAGETRHSTSGPRHPVPETGPSVLRTLDAWLPRDRSKPAHAVILLHGGGWEAGDRVTYITPVFEPLAAAGFAWFSIDYRLTPAVRHPGQLEDLRAAIAFIRRHAREFGVDPRRVVLVGESASAQMVTLLAAADRTLAGVVSFYGVYDFLPLVTEAGPRSLAARLFGRTVLDDETRRLLHAHSPLHQAARGMAPVLLIHGTDERLWEQGVRMAERLRELGVEHELIRLQGAPHGMENWEGHPRWEFYKARLVSWIRQRIQSPD